LVKKKCDVTSVYFTFYFIFNLDFKKKLIIYFSVSECVLNNTTIITAMRVICFDTETTGLPESKYASIYDTHKWPYIIQLSFVVYDNSRDAAGGIVEEYDEIIKVDESVNLTAKSIEIHGISREMSSERGIPVADALCAFKRALKSCDCCVGHNISFDKRILIVEAIRNKGFDPDDNSYVQLPFKNEFCTMLNSVDICKIEKMWKDGKKYFKYPTLLELHNHLFHISPKNAHNSKVDVLICLRCYWGQFRRLFRENCLILADR